jgi:hypothetical protein
LNEGLDDKLGPIGENALPKVVEVLLSIVKPVNVGDGDSPLRGAMMRLSKLEFTEALRVVPPYERPWLKRDELDV